MYNCLVVAVVVVGAAAAAAAVAAATIVEAVIVIVQVVVIVVVVVVVVAVLVHHCQNPKQYCIFNLPYHMLEVVNFTTGNYESGVASNDRLSILLWKLVAVFTNIMRHKIYARGNNPVR